MAYTGEIEERAIDFRVYIGMVVFRWQVIVLCFLYCLLGGVVYIQASPKEYVTRCNLTSYMDSLIAVSRAGSQWTSVYRHISMLQDPKLKERVVDRLFDKWGKKLGGRRQMMLNISTSKRSGSTVMLSVHCRDHEYGVEYLRVVLEEHKALWESLQRRSMEEATNMLEEELNKIADSISAAEDDIVEYQRLHDVTRTALRASSEESYIAGLVSRRRQLMTELMMLEELNPALKDENAEVIRDIIRLTRETGDVREEFDREDGDSRLREDRPMLPDFVDEGEIAEEDAEDPWNSESDRVSYIRLQQTLDELFSKFKPEHPKVQEVINKIKTVERQLKLKAEIQLARLRDRHRALGFELKAVETAEYKWQAKNYLARQRQAEYKRLMNAVGRYESNYNTLYARLHDMRVSEQLKAERYDVSEPATSRKPVWPDPSKILLVSVVLGLGSGFGLAVLLHVLDNKVQSIRDVEKILGVSFLGGIPFWVHGGLEGGTIRPIVTEEHSSGAVEAYRALRTSLLAALNKINEKVVMVTSADSREGKTLTVLNLAIMIAQMNKKVLLVDMDLRRGRLHRSLGVEKEPGLADVLVNRAVLRDVIKKSRIENMDFVATGRSFENAAELLQSGSLKAVFSDIQDDYDYILFDTSPVLRVTDTVIAANQGMGVIVYVARVNQTPKPLIRYSLTMLKDARVLGLIMNSIEMHKISSLYYTYQYPNYAYYSNAYAYGYNYYGEKTGVLRKQRAARRRSWSNVWRNALKWLRRTFLPM